MHLFAKFAANCVTYGVIASYSLAFMPSSDVHLFADDAKIFRHILGLCSDDQQRLQRVVNELIQWTQRWLLNLNVKNVKWSPLEEMLISTVHIQCYTMTSISRRCRQGPRCDV